MKEFANFETSFDGENGSAKASLGVDGENLSIALQANYPISKIVEPATKAMDALLDKLEEIIPGSWDKPIIAQFKEDYKKDLIKFIGE